MRLEFTKAVAAGNDFVLLDARGRDDLVRAAPRIARRVCDRREGIGADGVLLLCDPAGAVHAYAMRYVNADGSDAAMCGNGARCLALYAAAHGALVGDGTFSSEVGPCGVTVDGSRVTIAMPDGRLVRAPLEVEVDGTRTSGDWIDSGVPHFVSWMEGDAPARALARVDLLPLGRALRHHAAFGIAGANVDLAAEIATAGAVPRVAVRTYERGVEGETLGCGTGAIATAASWLRRAARPQGEVDVRTASGETIRIALAIDGDRLVDVRMTGGARLVFDGSIDIDLA